MQFVEVECWRQKIIKIIKCFPGLCEEVEILRAQRLAAMDQSNFAVARSFHRHQMQLFADEKGIIRLRNRGAHKNEFCLESFHLVKVDDVMSRDLYLVKPETTVEQAMMIVTESRCRHLTVMDGEEIIGLVSIGDPVKASLDEKDFVITQLNKYIKGEH